MYLRFAGLNREPSVGVAPGIFWTSSGLPLEGDWRHAEIARVLDWFNDHLDVPLVLERRLGRHGIRQGVCWFRDDARAHIAQARYFAWLLTDVGRPVRELRAHRPGTEIWRDDHQVVFVPARDSLVHVI